MGFAAYEVLKKLRRIMRNKKSSRHDSVVKNVKLVLKKGVDKIKLVEKAKMIITKKSLIRKSRTKKRKRVPMTMTSDESELFNKLET